VTSTRRSKCRIQEGHTANDHTSSIYNQPSLAEDINTRPAGRATRQPSPSRPAKEFIQIAKNGISETTMARKNGTKLK
jgi:hypothetical protein